jgi:hypothetical protein
MAKTEYRAINFGAAKLRLIEQAAAIVEEYEAQGFDLTLRQLYYQCVTRLIIPNKFTEYKRLGDTITDARYAGLIDWDSISDRGRALEAVGHWADVPDMILAAYQSHRLEKWQDQPHWVEVWIEKDALSGVFEPVCQRLDVPYFACKGYTSASEMYKAAVRLMEKADRDQRPVILHFGDHDPSGVDMTRDIAARLTEFMEHDGYDGPEVIRCALSLDQVARYQIPENPVKLSDGRAQKYITRYGTESSWELDALDPAVLTALVEDHVAEWRDEEKWDAMVEREARERELLRATSRHWGEIAAIVERMAS